MTGTHPTPRVRGRPCRCRGARVGLRRRRRVERRDDRDDPADVVAQGRARRGRGAAERQRLQRARLQGPEARGARDGDHRPRGRGEDRCRLRAEHVHARPPGLRPHHRGRLRAGRRDRRHRQAVPRHELRDHRRRPVVPEGQAGERPGPPLPRGAGGLPRRVPRRARGREGRRQGDQRRGRLQGAAGRPLHRRLQGRCARRRCPGRR